MFVSQSNRFPRLESVLMGRVGEFFLNPMIGEVVREVPKIGVHDKSRHLLEQEGRFLWNRMKVHSKHAPCSRLSCLWWSPQQVLRMWPRWSHTVSWAW